MAKYLLIGSYTAEGAKGVLKDGGSARRKAAQELCESVGGSLDAIYWGFGDDDFYAVTDFPSADAAAAAALTISGSGAIRAKTVVLITAEELDRASKLSVTYRPPGR
jgi:uncharacterized protein with GYD domain